MKKMVFTIAVAVLLSIVGFAQVTPTTYNRHALSSCLGWHEVLQRLSTSGEGSTKVYVAGFTDLLDACGSDSGLNPPNVGQKHGVGSTVPPHYPAFTQTGPVLDVGDDWLTYQCFCLSGYAFEWLIDLKNSEVAGFYSFVGNDTDYWWYWDYIAPGLPSKDSPNMGKLPLNMPKPMAGMAGMSLAR
jgi:hypothetical protein